MLHSQPQLVSTRRVGQADGSWVLHWGMAAASMQGPVDALVEAWLTKV